MNLLHFIKGNSEYIVLTESETKEEWKDWAKPGYELHTVAEIVDGPVGRTDYLPTESAMEKED